MKNYIKQTISDKLDNILKKECKFVESVDINFVISFGMKDVKGNRKKSKVFTVIDFPFKVKAKNKILILCDEMDVKNQFDNIVITPVEAPKLHKKDLKRVDAVLSLGSAMSRFTNQHKILGTKNLSPKENENTLYKKKEELVSSAKKFMSGLKQRICFNLLQKTCILNCSVGTIESPKEEIMKNIERLENFISKEELKEMFGLSMPKNLKILSRNITSTMYKEEKEK